MRWEFEHASGVRKRAREQIQRSRVLTQTLIIPHNRQTTQSQVQAAQSLLRNVKDGERLGQTRTRPDTRPIPVADGWAGAEMRVFTLSNSITTDRPTNQPTNGRTDGRTDKASYRVACPRLKKLKMPVIYQVKVCRFCTCFRAHSHF